MNYRLTLQRYNLFAEMALDYSDKIVGQMYKKCHESPNLTTFNSPVTLFP